MPHQCTKCGNIFPDAAEELLKGCNCGSRFFYYIRQERLDSLEQEYQDTIIELEKADKEQIERDIRELTGMDKEPDKPVILDLESVRVVGPGKFEIDIVNLFSKRRPLIYKLEEGKYIIDLASSLSIDKKDIDRRRNKPEFNKLIFESKEDEDEEDIIHSDKEFIEENDDKEKL